MTTMFGSALPSSPVVWGIGMLVGLLEVISRCGPGGDAPRRSRSGQTVP
jgi:hypothetical protein